MEFNILKLGKIALLEIIVIVVLAVLCILWMIDTSGPYEPYLVFFGLVLACTDFYRRHKVEVITPNNLSEPSKIFIKKPKLEGVIAQCSSVSCNRVARNTDEAEAYFGFRTMQNGLRRVQSYCRKCR